MHLRGSISTSAVHFIVSKTVSAVRADATEDRYFALGLPCAAFSSFDFDISTVFRDSTCYMFDIALNSMSSMHLLTTVACRTQSMCVLKADILNTCCHGAPWSRKVMEFSKTIFQAWKVMENDDSVVIFTTAPSNSVKVTQIMNRNVILLTQFALVYLLTSFLQLWSLEMVCIHKSYIVYFCYVDRSWIFIFWAWKSHGKSVLEKRGHPVL